jgi:Uma2 family endonuclease
MIQTQTKTVAFDEFVTWYPENSVHKYELHNGVIVEMPLGTGDHSDVMGFIRLKLSVEIDRRELPYSIPGDYLLKPVRNDAGYQPDVFVLIERNWQTNRVGKKNPSSRWALLYDWL